MLSVDQFPFTMPGMGVVEPVMVDRPRLMVRRRLVVQCRLVVRCVFLGRRGCFGGDRRVHHVIMLDIPALILKLGYRLLGGYRRGGRCCRRGGCSRRVGGRRGCRCRRRFGGAWSWNSRNGTWKFRLCFDRQGIFAGGRFGNGYDVVVLRGEESFPRPQLFAGQRHAAAGGTAGGVVVDRAHSCSPLVEVSGSLPEAACSVGALLGFSDSAGACTRRPMSVPLAFCMSIACWSIPAAAT